MTARLHFYVQDQYAFMRENPDDKAKVVSQTFFSEEIDVIDAQGPWSLIQTSSDGYRGWAKTQALSLYSQEQVLDERTTLKTDRLLTHIFSEKDTERGPIYTLPFESRLTILDEPEDSNRRWIHVRLINGIEGYVQRGDVKPHAELVSLDKIVEFSKKFLGLAFAFGGRSSFGYDCSGFAQMLFRQMGVYIPRDAKDQFSSEKFADAPLDKAQPGDLIFWQNSVGKVNHVGMCIGNNQFIHSTVAELQPYIRISNFVEDPYWNKPIGVVRRLKILI